MDENERLAEHFEQHRPRLRAVAYRMLGSLADVDDAVQDAWLRLSQSDVERAIAADGDAVRVAFDGPAADDFLVACGNGRKGFSSRGASEQNQKTGGDTTPRVCRRNVR